MASDISGDLQAVSPAIGTEPRGKAAAWLRRIAWVELLCLCLLPVIAAIPLVPLVALGGWPDSHEDLRYIFLLEHFREAIQGGVLYPRWLPELYGGYGYPTFVYYQPGFFYWTLPYSMVTTNPLAVFQLSLYGLCLTGTIGAWLLCRTLAERLTATFCASLFMLTPYLFVNLYIRGDLSELMAMLLTPWPLYFLFKLGDKAVAGTGRAILPATGAALSLALIVMSHPITAMFFLPVFCVFAAWLGIALPVAMRTKFWVNAGLALAAALAASAPYWSGLVLMTRHIDVASAVTGFYAAKIHVVHLPQLFEHGWSHGRSVPGPDDTMPFQLGLPHFLFALGGLLGARRNRAIQAAFVCYLLAIAAMLSVATPIWTLPLLDKVQFPWRLLSVTAVLQMLCAAGLWGFLRRANSKRGLYLLLGALLLMTWQSDQFRMRPLPDSLSRADLDELHGAEGREFETHTQENEFLPKWLAEDALKRPRRDAALLAIKGAGKARALDGDSPYRIRYRVTAKRPVTAVIRQLYFPGWRVEVDGKPIDDRLLRERLEKDGLIRFSLESGEHVVEAWYEGPPGAPLRNALALAVVLFVSLVLRLNLSPAGLLGSVKAELGVKKDPESPGAP